MDYSENIIRGISDNCDYSDFISYITVSYEYQIAGWTLSGGPLIRTGLELRKLQTVNFLSKKLTSPVRFELSRFVVNRP